MNQIKSRSTCWGYWGWGDAIQTLFAERSSTNSVFLRTHPILGSTVKDLQSMHSKHLSQPDLDGGIKEEHAIEIVTQEITTVCSHCRSAPARDAEPAHPSLLTSLPPAPLPFSSSTAARKLSRWWGGKATPLDRTSRSA